jgi:hypothetical protein
MPRVPILGILRLPTWEFRNKMTFGCSPVVNHREYYKEEGDVFPQVQVIVSLVSPCMPLVCLCTKNAQTMH